MKNLELNQMEAIKGEGWGIGFYCGLTILGAVGGTIATMGSAAILATYAAAAMCGWEIGAATSN